MVKRRKNRSNGGLLLVSLLFFLNVNVSTADMRLSDSFGSATRLISQNYTLHDPIIITNDSKLAAVAVNGTGVANDPYILANWNITSSPTHGIFIDGTTKHFRIENCWIVSSNNHGICVSNVPTGTTTIINNTCNGNTDSGIGLYYSVFSTIANNTCNKNRDAGVYLWDCDGSILTNNICNSNNMNGIGLYGSGFSTLVNNTCIGNSWVGIYFSGSGSSTLVNNTCSSNGIFGISLYICSFSILINNTCSNNNDDAIILRSSGFSTLVNNTCDSNGRCGFYLEFSDNNSIVWNTILNNGYYGVSLNLFSENNIIHHNCFIANGLEESQAIDDGWNNQWYDQTVLEGNSWFDYSGTDSYLIAGSAEASDLYPSMTSETDINSTSPPTFTDASFLLVRIFLFLFLFFFLFLFVRRHDNLV